MKAIEKLKEEDKRKALACKWHNEVKSLERLKIIRDL